MRKGNINNDNKRREEGKNVVQNTNRTGKSTEMMWKREKKRIMMAI